MEVSLIGCGWFGTELAKALMPTHTVFGTTRSHTQLLADLGIRVTTLVAPSAPNELLKKDVIVLNIPPFVGQLEWFQTWDWDQTKKIIFISSTSVYGTNLGLVDEATLPVPTTENGALLLAEEAWIKTFPRHLILRPGGLLGGERHPGKHLSGRTQLADGDAPVNLIHRDDLVAFTKFCIEYDVPGLFNLVSPDHPSRQSYYQTYCREHKLPLPQFLAGGENGKMISSEKAQRICALRALASFK